MIMETALITVQTGQEEQFLVAMEEAKKVLAQANGFEVIHVHRGVERPSTFLLAIGWETLEHHMVEFREGPLFPQWRAIIGPFFAEPPTVEHWQLFED